MAKVDQASMTNWNDGDTIHAAEYKQERDLLIAAINDNYDRTVARYTKTEVDNLLTALKGPGWTAAITLKSNYDLIQGILSTRYTKTEVDALLDTNKNGDHLGTWRGLTPGQASEAINGARLDVVEAQLDPITSQPINVLYGTAVYNAVRDSLVKLGGLTGRTLVNLLGREGGFEVDADSNGIGNGWTSLQSTGTPATYSLDATIFRYGTRSQKIVNATASNNARINRNFTAETGKYYLFAGEVYSSVVGEARIGATSNTLVNQWETLYTTLTGAGSTVVLAVYGSSAAASVTTYIDGVRLYTIDATEKAYIDGLTVAEAQAYIAKKYPYVDSLQSIFNPYLIGEGKNLLPPFTEAASIHGNAKVDEPYTLILNATGNDQRTYSATISVVPNTTYTITFESISAGGQWAIDGGNGNFSDWVVTYRSALSATFTTTATQNQIRVQFSNSTAGAGIFTWVNPMLNIGTTALPFEPQRKSYSFIQSILRSDTLGNNADELHYDDNGQPNVLRKQGFKVLDGLLDWTFHSDAVGSKIIKFTRPSNISFSSSSPKEVVVKYDGKILKTDHVTYPLVTDSTLIDSTMVYICVADTDSGWNETVNPTSDTIRAYFNGWKLVDVNGNQFISGTGYYQSIVDGTGRTSDVSYVLTHYASGYTPYTLQYQLATPVSEPVTIEGDLLVHEGLNQITMGAGVIVREVANPFNNGSEYRLNNVNHSTSLLKNRVRDFIEVYKGLDVDSSKWTKTGTNGYGNYALFAPLANVDPAAAYSVTYLALDMYALGFAPQSIDATYEGNLAEVVRDLTYKLQEAHTEISVLQATKANRQQPGWIAPTLLNAWTNYNTTEAQVGYFKNDLGEVRIKGLVKGGTVTNGTVIFYLPVGFRPKDPLKFPTVNYNGSTYSSAQVNIMPDGKVSIETAANNYLGLNITFRAEQ